MATSSQFIGGVPVPEVDAAQLENALQGMLSQSAQAGAPALAMFAQMQQNRAARIGAAAKTLRAQLGKDDPRVASAEAAAASVADFGARVDMQKQRIDRWPVPRADEWMVFGTVVDAQGSPASGLTVRVFDRDRKYDDLLGGTETDDLGDFAVLYSARAFKEVGEKLPDLYVTVSDASGNVIYSSRSAVRYEAGRSEYFAIRLEAPAPGSTQKTPAPKAAAPKTAARHRK